MTPGLFVFTITAPEGTWHARFHLLPGRRYGPGDVRVEAGTPTGEAAHVLTVTATHRPTEAEFREMAARAATRTADDSPDELRRLLNLLIPF